MKMEIEGLEIKVNTAKMTHDEVQFSLAIKAIGGAYRTLPQEVIDMIIELKKSVIHA
jgi:hypothetical protein